MQVVLSSLYIHNDISLLKLAALYADKIILRDTDLTSSRMVEAPEDGCVRLITRIFRTLPPEIRPTLQPLIDAGIVTVRTAAAGVDERRPFCELFDVVALEYFRKDSDEGPIYVNDTEIALASRRYSPCLEALGRNDSIWSAYNDIVNLYGLVGHAMIEESLQSGATVVTDSRALRNMFGRYASTFSSVDPKQRVNQAAAALANAVLSESLPGIRDAAIDDILEVRERMAPELEAFRFAMARLSSDVASTAWQPRFEMEVAEVVETTVKPSVRELKQRLNSARHRAVLRVFESLQNPATYVPLIGSVVADLPPAVGVLASMGIASFKAIYESWLENQAIRQENGLVLLVAPKGPAAQWVQVDR